MCGDKIQMCRKSTCGGREGWGASMEASRSGTVEAGCIIIIINEQHSIMEGITTIFTASVIATKARAVIKFALSE